MCSARILSKPQEAGHQDCVELVADHGVRRRLLGCPVLSLLCHKGAHIAGLGNPFHRREYAACPSLVLHSKSERGALMEKVVTCRGADKVDG
jgi:hypothetical protein